MNHKNAQSLLLRISPRLPRLLFLAAIALLPAISPAQTFEWVAGIQGPNSTDIKAIATDANGNVITVGSFDGTQDMDPGAGVSNLTALGQSDIFVSKLDVNGNLVWAKQCSGASGTETANAVALDASGNIYVVGDFFLTVDFDPGSGVSNLASVGQRDGFILKLDAAGNFVWVHHIASASFDGVASVKLDNAGNIYTAGTIGAAFDFDPGAGVASLSGGNNLFILKLDPSRNFGYVKGLTGVSAAGIDVDALGNLVYCGAFTGTVDSDPGAGSSNLTSLGSDDGMVLRLDASGSFSWSFSLGSSAYDAVRAVQFDPSGNVVVGGDYSGQIDLDFTGAGSQIESNQGQADMFLVKAAANGSFLWGKALGGIELDYVNGIEVSQNGDVFTTGNFGGTIDFDPGAGTANFTTVPFASDGYIHALDSNGNYKWLYRIEGTRLSAGRTIALDPAGDLVVGGYFWDTTDFAMGSATAFLYMSNFSNDGFVLKVSECYTSIIGLGSSYCSNDQPVTLFNVPNTGTYSGPGITGNVFDPALAGIGTHTIMYTQQGCVSSSQTVTVDGVSGSFTSLANQDTVTFTSTVTGATSYLWDFGDGQTSTTANPVHTYANSGTYTVCLTITNGTCSDTICEQVPVLFVGMESGAEANVQVFPNPSTGIFHVQAAHGMTLTVFDSQGRMVMTGAAQGGNTLLDLSKQPAGIYLLDLQGPSGRRMVKLLKQE